MIQMSLPGRAPRWLRVCRAANAGSTPILFRVNFDAGHGLTDTIAQQVSDWTDVFTFFLWNFGDPDFQPTAFINSSTPAARGGD